MQCETRHNDRTCQSVPEPVFRAGRQLLRMVALLSFLAYAQVSFAATVYVLSSPTGSGDGSSWENATSNLAEAVNNAVEGTEVWVGQGTYGPIALKDGVRIYGGFVGRESSAAESDPKLHQTTISGGGRERAVTSIRNDATAVLRGFHIVDGFLEIPEVGGGLYLENSNATIIRCIFTGNRVEYVGGAIANIAGSPTFLNCEFFGNEAGVGGGAVLTRRSGNPTFVNCLFYDNKATAGGAIASISGEPTFINCTITENAAMKFGGAFYDHEGTAILRNSILWSNSTEYTATDSFYNNMAVGGVTTATDSNIDGAWPGMRNLSVDPLFVNAAAHDYRLRSDSPCRNKGDSSRLPSNTADLDLDGQTSLRLTRDLAMNPRVTGSAVNMGAYE